MSYRDMAHGKKRRSQGPTESDLYRQWLQRAIDDLKLADRLRAVVAKLRDPATGWLTAWGAFEAAIPSSALPSYIREALWFALVSTVAIELEFGPIPDPPDDDGEVREHDWVQDLVDDLDRVHRSGSGVELVLPGGFESDWMFSDFPIVRWSVPLAECGPVSFSKMQELARKLEQERQRAWAKMLGAAPDGPDPSGFKPKLPHPKAPRSLRPLMLARMVRDLHGDSGWRGRVQAWLNGKRSTNKEVAEEMARRHPGFDAHNLESDLSKLRRVVEAFGRTGRQPGPATGRAILGADLRLLAIARVFQSLAECSTTTQKTTRRRRSPQSSPSRPRRSRGSST